MGDGIFTLVHFGLYTSAQVTSHSVYDYLIFDANVVGVQSAEGGCLWQAAGVIYVDCGLS